MSIEDTKIAPAFGHAVAHGEPAAVADLAWSARALAYGKRKTAFMFDIEKLAAGDGISKNLLASCETLLAEYSEVLAGFCRRWAAENRRSEIDIALLQFTHGANGLQIVKNWLLEHQQEFAPGKQLPLPEVPAIIFPWKENCFSAWISEE